MARRLRGEELGTVDLCFPDRVENLGGVRWLLVARRVGDGLSARRLGLTVT